MRWVHNRKANIERQKNKFVIRICIYVSIVVAITALCILAYRFINSKIHNSNSIAALEDNWAKYDYQKVYEISTAILADKPLNTTARMFHGYSSFFLAVSQTDNSVTEAYLKDALKSLRIALQKSGPENKGQLEYMLGRCYFYKDISSNYQYYADLAIKYLLLAQEDGYDSDDIAECLGLSYAALGETQKSIEAFGEALLVRESDTLLLSIAEQYYKIGNMANAKAYLFRVRDLTKNEDLILRTSFLLGEIFVEENELEDAEKEFRSILQKNENSADAHYGLGVLYEKQGDSAKARAQWRRVLRIQPNHEGALKKMSDL
ncbi:MAG: tetratricopeptide repeat protein [Treponema sp.]|nr:tetratricopeptide repeat protein [Treponema sp.]